MRRIILSSLVACAIGAAQTRTLEVASAKPDKSGLVSNVGGRGGSLRVQGSQLTAENCSLWKLIAAAYDFAEDKDYAISGPDWLKSERFNVVAKIPPGTNVAAMREMLQNLLAERFQLAVHRGSKELPFYALVVTKGGSKLQPAEETGQSSFSMTPGLIKAVKAPLPAFADRLAQFVNRPIIDETGLAGIYDFKLEWTPEAPMPAPGETPPSSAGPSIFTAIQEQLGLRLEARKGPVQVLIVDHAERVPTGN